MKKFPLLLVLTLVFLISACKKDTDNTTLQPAATTAPVNVNIAFEVDGDSLAFDVIKYMNAAGNHYSVHSVSFYLSQISLVKPDSSTLQIKDYLYVDARSSNTLNVSIKDVPIGCYTGINFNIGVDSAHNIPDGLPATPENLAMEWPVPMGGGYHFLKLEGYFTDTSGTPGFAMHIGRNQFLCKVSLQHSFCVSSAGVSKTLVMNINEWFRNPSDYDFNVDGNYSMGNMPGMGKLASNGTDVFTIK